MEEASASADTSKIGPILADKCVYFHSKQKEDEGKRKKHCRADKKCSFFHDEEHPTRWEQKRERRAKQLEKALWPKVRGLGEGCLRSPTVALRSYLRSMFIDDSIVRTTEILDEGGDLWLDVKLSGAQEPSDLALQISERLGSVSHNCCWVIVGDAKAVQITTTGWASLKGKILWHGTDIDSAWEMCKEKKIRMSGDPPAIYGCQQKQQVIKHGYVQGVAFYYETCSVEGSKEPMKSIGGCFPGVSFYNGNPQKKGRAAPEWHVHEDSLSLKGMHVRVDFMEALLKAWHSKELAKLKYTKDGAAAKGELIPETRQLSIFLENPEANPSKRILPEWTFNPPPPPAWSDLADAASPSPQRSLKRKSPGKTLNPPPPPAWPAAAASHGRSSASSSSGSKRP